MVRGQPGACTGSMKQSPFGPTGHRVIDRAEVATTGTPAPRTRPYHSFEIFGHIEGTGYRLVMAAHWRELDAQGRPRVDAPAHRVYEVDVLLPFRSRPSLGDLMGAGADQLRLMRLHESVMECEGMDPLPGL